MKTVWKYPIKIHDEQLVEMPGNAHILCAQVQHGQVCLWALVNPEMPPESRKILITGTGHEREDLDFAQYIGT
ncbi:MAG TPA: hypothetical protein VLA89_06090, partial [Gemmatimonadales bacterium]|nr:hypothetical protein [Gemmatimonadales bacterium]